MSTISPIEKATRVVVDAVRSLHHHRTGAAVSGLVLTLVAALIYLVGGSLGINPLRSSIGVKVLLKESGGLLPNQDVTLRGVRIGRVNSVQFTRTGVLADAEIDGGVRVPQNSLVRVSALSPAGEQYLDFRPQAEGGPALSDGATITESRTSVPVSLAQLLADADGTLAQLSPEKLRVITDEMKVSNQGPQKLAALLDGGAFMITALDSVLPQTMSLIRTSRTVLTTMVDGSAGLRQTSANLNKFMRGANAAQGGFRTLVDRGGQPLAAIDQLIADNSETMVKLLGNLTTLGQLMTVRVPALNELLDSKRGGSGVENLTSVVRDGGIWVIADIYPRYSCDYNVPRLPPALANYPEPYVNTYCNNPDPAVLVRGARNAPRPPGDDTAGPAPGSDPLAQMPGTELTPSSVDRRFGGLQLPVKLPPDPKDWTPPPGWPGKPLPPPPKP
jgi:virulence factor Mce-like protein